MLNVIGGIVVGFVGMRTGLLVGDALTSNWVETQYKVYDGNGALVKACSDVIPFRSNGEVKIVAAMWAPFWAFHGTDRSIVFTDPKGRETEVYGPRHPDYRQYGTVSRREILSV